MEINAVFTESLKGPQSVVDMFDYEPRNILIKDHLTGKVVFQADGVMVPKNWSDQAAKIAVSKYFRKAGVPSKTRTIVKDGVPKWLLPSVAEDGAEFGPEKHIVSVVHRIVGHWTYTGFINGYFDPGPKPTAPRVPNRSPAIRAAKMTKTLGELPPSSREVLDFIAGAEANARNYYNEMFYTIVNQMGAPNSPQWFNTGLWWAYGISGSPQGHFRVFSEQNGKWIDPHANNVEEARRQVYSLTHETNSLYEYPQVHACFIISLEDNMLGHNGIYEWIAREARIFKGGSGSGVNISKLRGENEPLSGGGKSSGSMSWMKIADRSAAAIKSGGVTRRAAKMVCMDLDHPDIVEFINCKLQAELQVSAMFTGSQVITSHCQGIMDIVVSGNLSGLDQAVNNAKAASVHPGYIQRAIVLARDGKKTWIGHPIPLEYEGEAFATVPYQNANNSVRIPSSFFEAVDKDQNWDLKSRAKVLGGKVLSSVSARKLEGDIAAAAWHCADPGVQFDTIINDWNVTPVDGRINASNPCSEHMRLDGSACNLASMRLTKFYDYETRTFDSDRFYHATRLWQITLDISNSMAQLPDAETAANVFMYRDTGLGFADLGSLLMGMGIPYDSDEGRSIAGIITAMMQAQCHETSAEMAAAMGQYPRFKQNAAAHLRCVKNHANAASSEGQFDGLSVKPVCIDWEAVSFKWSGFRHGVTNKFAKAINQALKTGFRNAEMTVIAPTGTIGFVMDCDTTGVEPMYGTVVYKTLAGGGTMKLAPTQAVFMGLKNLGYEPNDVLSDVADNTGRIIGLKMNIKEEHLKVFDTAATDPVTKRCLNWQSHVMMMGAVQSFISGAISKTTNMPEESTVEDIKAAYRLSHKLGVKALAVYRDKSKLSQPMETFSAEAESDDTTVVSEDIQTQIFDMVKTAASRGLASPIQAQVRVRLPVIRKPGIDICVGFGAGNVYVRTTRYSDGKLGEIWINYSPDQSIVQALISQVCKVSNVALQYGVPPEAVLKTMIGSRFDPSGLVSHPYIKTATSILDLAAKIIALHELDDDSVCNVSPKTKISSGELAVVDNVITAGSKMGIVVNMTTEKCPACNSREYVTSGTGCKKCQSCGHAGGCG